MMSLHMLLKEMRVEKFGEVYCTYQLIVRLPFMYEFMPSRYTKGCEKPNHKAERQVLRPSLRFDLCQIKRVKLDFGAH